MPRPARLVTGSILAAIGIAALYLCLWPVPVDPVAWQAPADRGLVDPFAVNDRLAGAQTIDLGEHHGPEDLTVGFGGLLYATTESGRIVSFSPGGGDVSVFADAGGRPLGIEFADGFLYVANAYLGLQRIRQDGRVISVVSEFEGETIGYADDVAVAQNGMVYFSDASRKFAARDWGGTYAASLLDILEHGGHGRILKYDPFSNETSLIADNLNFANGVAVCPDQTCLLIVETGSYRIWRHWLEGPDAGTGEVIVDNLPGFPDNINNGLNGRYWIGLVAPRNALLDRFSDSPFWRRLMQRLPAAVRPQAVPSTHLIAIDGDGQVLMNLHDSKAGFPTVTGAIETEQYIYMSSLFGNRIARISKHELE